MKSPRLYRQEDQGSNPEESQQRKLRRSQRGGRRKTGDGGILEAKGRECLVEGERKTVLNIAERLCKTKTEKFPLHKIT